MSSDKPNVIYILSDEHRGQAMGHMGDPNLRTPAMDALAAGGVSFSRAYANCPICTPSRGTIFSGRHAHSGPVAGFFDNYKINAPSTATVLRAAGYHTAYYGKWHCGIVRDQRPPEVVQHPDEYKGCSSRTPERHRAGFEDWRGFENLNQHFASYYYCDDDINPTKTPGYETDGLTDLVIDYLREYDRDEPLFLVLSVTPPHFPLIVPDEWKRFDPAGLEVRPNFTDTPEMRERLANYYAMIENLDWNIGRLMQAIRELPKFSNTLTSYISDHGDFMGSHSRHSRKEHPHEKSVRIPGDIQLAGPHTRARRHRRAVQPGRPAADHAGAAERGGAAARAGHRLLAGGAGRGVRRAAGSADGDGGQPAVEPRFPRLARIRRRAMEVCLLRKRQGAAV